jgi:hypothetical protein
MLTFKIVIYSMIILSTIMYLVELAKGGRIDA